MQRSLNRVLATPYSSVRYRLVLSFTCVLWVALLSACAPQQHAVHRSLDAETAYQAYAPQSQQSYYMTAASSVTAKQYSRNLERDMFLWDNW